MRLTTLIHNPTTRTTTLRAGRPARIRLLGLALALIGSCLARDSAADAIIFTDGVWVVTGISATQPGEPVLDAAVGGQPVGSFAALTVAREFAGTFPVIYTIRATGGLQPVVPPNGAPGGAFHLTGYRDCFAGDQLDLRITALNVVPNKTKPKSLQFTGALSNGQTLQAGDLQLRLDLPKNTVRLKLRYTLVATANLCVDQSAQFYGDGFLVARMDSNYLSNEVGANDGARFKAFLDQGWSCCGRRKGWLCANFSNTTGYVLPHPAWMAGKEVIMRRSRFSQLPTPTLRIDLKSPSRNQSSVQAHALFSVDPAADNVSLWINWDFADYQFAVGQRVRKIKLDLIAMPPVQENCDRLLP